jgi:hypothetical protein
VTGPIAPGGPPRGPAERGLVALYAFDEGRGRIVRDTSGYGRPLDLEVADVSCVRWLPEGGLELRSPTVLASPGPATKVIEACRKTNELTVEAWIVPARLNPATGLIGTDRIVTLSADTARRNFTLGQGEMGSSPATFSARLRTTSGKAGAANGLPALVGPKAATPGGGPVHVVFSRAADGRSSLWIDGELRASRESEGSFENWSEEFRLALGQEVTGDTDALRRLPPGLEPTDGDEEMRSWLGAYRRVAVFCRALSAEEVRRRFEAERPR